MKSTLFSVTVFIAGCFLAGCQKTEVTPANPSAVKEPTTAIRALYTAQPITIDGLLDEPVWKKAIHYTFAGPKSFLKKGHVCTQPARVMLAWDEEYLYVAGVFEDKDLYAYGQDDGMSHFQYGDLLEVFLRPDDGDATWYWEMYSTPAGKKTVYFFLSPGARVSGVPQPGIPQEMAVASAVNGTVNEWQDRDVGWVTEMRIPFSMLRQYGRSIPSEHWRVLCARYNYDRLNEYIEYSSYPQLSKVNYHLIQEYARLVFAKE